MIDPHQLFFSYCETRDPAGRRHRHTFVYTIDSWVDFVQLLGNLASDRAIDWITWHDAARLISVARAELTAASIACHEPPKLPD